MKIKWNWGTKLTIFTVLFMIFILTMVYLTTLQDRSMVEDEYYQKSMVYQETIDKKNNARQLDNKVQINLGTEFLSIRFQESFEPEDISGTIQIYRPSNSKLDNNISIELDSSRTLLIPKRKLTKGKYYVKIDYKYGDKGYYQEEAIYVD